jgi:hypothetical protein
MAIPPKRKASKRPARARFTGGRISWDTPLSSSVGDGVADVLARLATAGLAPKAVDPIQWLEEARWLSPESSREVGPFRFARAQYLEKPQRAILDPPVPEVIVDWASQSGKTELELNAILYWSVHAPAPPLVVAPDWKSAKNRSGRVAPGRVASPARRDRLVFDARRLGPVWADPVRGRPVQRGAPPWPKDVRAHDRQPPYRYREPLPWLRAGQRLRARGGRARRVRDDRSG